MIYAGTRGSTTPHKGQGLSRHPSGRKALAPLFVSSDIYRATGYGPGHPLSIPRIGPVVDICRQLGWLDDSNYRDSDVATLAQLDDFHTADYLGALVEASHSGQVSAEVRQRHRLGTMENPLFPGLLQRAATSVGGSIQAARLAAGGRIVYHPAGGTHHGSPDRASGFCYFNDPVFAILEFLRLGHRRVAYLDVDAHHGDGVEAAFRDDPRVLTMSLHEAGKWPHSGTESGCGALNFPLPGGACDAELELLMTAVIEPALHSFQPQALVLTCGADALAGDPLSSLQFSNRALWRAVTRAVAKVPAAVVVGGGGYNPWTTVRCWAGLWGVLNEQAMPSELPSEARRLLESFECDLIDEEDIEPAWLTGLADPATESTARPAVRELIERWGDELREGEAVAGESG